MGNKLFVGNISWGATDQDLKDLFGEFGDISEATIITDRETGRSKGFGFVTFVNAEDAEKALSLDKHELDGRPINVSEAKQREE